MTWEPRFDPHTRAHAHDPDTSYGAARRARRLVAQHKFTILNRLRLDDIYYRAKGCGAGVGGLTSQEISDRCKLNYHQVARRISDLKRDGKVIDSGQRRASPGGRRAAVWRLA